MATVDLNFIQSLWLVKDIVNQIRVNYADMDIKSLANLTTYANNAIGIESGDLFDLYKDVIVVTDNLNTGVKFEFNNAYENHKHVGAVALTKNYNAVSTFYETSWCDAVSLVSYLGTTELKNFNINFNGNEILINELDCAENFDAIHIASNEIHVKISYKQIAHNGLVNGANVISNYAKINSFAHRIQNACVEVVDEGIDLNAILMLAALDQVKTIYIAQPTKNMRYDHQMDSSLRMSDDPASLSIGLGSQLANVKARLSDTAGATYKVKTDNGWVNLDTWIKSNATAITIANYAATQDQQDLNAWLDIVLGGAKITTINNT